jgi:cytochrome c oxidase assembly protein subunit 11
MSTRRPERAKALTALALASVIVGMLGLTAAAVPLYRLFCQATGYGGTTQRAEAAPGQQSAQTITVRFNADVAQDLPWTFAPVARAVQVSSTWPSSGRTMAAAGRLSAAPPST